MGERQLEETSGGKKEEMQMEVKQVLNLLAVQVNKEIQSQENHTIHTSLNIENAHNFLSRQNNIKL